MGKVFDSLHLLLGMLSIDRFFAPFYTAAESPMEKSLGKNISTYPKTRRIHEADKACFDTRRNDGGSV
jgi:hypothetical protein